MSKWIISIIVSQLYMIVAEVVFELIYSCTIALQINQGQRGWMTLDQEWIRSRTQFICLQVQFLILVFNYPTYEQ